MTPNYPGHVPLSAFSRAFLAVGSGVMSLISPARGDMVAVLSETTAGPFLGALRDKMLADEGGRRLLRERPRITEKSVEVDELRKMADGTLGREYVRWLEDNKVSPDTREPVRFIDDPELAYVMQRYRESHDFYHLIIGPFPVSTPGELIVKLFEFANAGLPVALMSSVLGPLRLKTHAERAHLYSTYASWALKCGSSAKPLINVEWERRWADNVDDLRRELGIWKLPIEYKEYKRREKERKARVAAATAQSHSAV